MLCCFAATCKECINLHRAAFHGHEGCMEALLKALPEETWQEKIHARERKMHNQPLHIAARMGHLKVARLLLIAGV